MPSGGPLLEIPAQYPFGNWGAPHFSVCATVEKKVVLMRIADLSVLQSLI